jgi:uncharacterized membrane protein
MLRPSKFKRSETTIAYGFSILLFVVGIAAIVFSLLRAQWLLGFSGLGIISVATIYLLAAIRRRPL